MTVALENAETNWQYWRTRALKSEAERDALREALEFARPALELLATEEARRNMHCRNRGLPIKTTAAERLAKADAALNSTDGETRR